MSVSHYILLLTGAVLINNIVLVRMLGLCPFLGVSQKLESAIGMGAATSFVLTLASALTYIIDQYLLIPFDIAYLRTLFFIVVIAAVVQVIEMLIRKLAPILYQALGIYLPLITTNCAVLGVPLLSISLEYSFLESVLFGFGNALGFTLVLVLFAGLRDRIDVADVPEAFRGAPIAIITAAMMSLAFMGFNGLTR